MGGWVSCAPGSNTGAMHSSFCIQPSAFAIKWSVVRSPQSAVRLQALQALCRSLVGALGTHWGGFVGALGWPWNRNRLPSNRPWGGFEVALMSHEGYRPLLGGSWRLAGQRSGGSQAEKLVELPLHGAWDGIERRLMKGMASSLAGIHWPTIPKWGDRQVCLIT
jgi:hypothetical protein